MNADSMEGFQLIDITRSPSWKGRAKHSLARNDPFDLVFSVPFPLSHSSSRARAVYGDDRPREIQPQEVKYNPSSTSAISPSAILQRSSILDSFLESVATGTTNPRSNRPTMDGDVTRYTEIQGLGGFVREQSNSMGLASPLPDGGRFW